MNQTDGKTHARKHAFALASQLIPRLNQRGITEMQLWEAVKSDYGVESRSEIDELGWVILTARLDAAQRHRQLFDNLCRGITGGTL